MRKRLLIFAAALLAVPVVVLGAALLYLRFGDLSRHRARVEDLLSEAIGRELRIHGEFRPRLGRTLRLVAGDVTLANPDWSDEPTMLSVGRLAGEVELLPLLSGEIRIHEVEVERLRVLVELDGTGRSNWQLARDVPPAEPGPRPEISIRSITLRDGAVVYRDPSLDQPLELTVEGLDIGADEAGMLDLRLDGAVGGEPLALGGRAGPIDGLVKGSRVEADLAGRLGDMEIGIRGRVAELPTLAGVDASLHVAGPDLARTGEGLGQPGLPSGPFGITVGLSPAGRGAALSVEATLADNEARAAGSLDSLLAPSDVDMTFNASGPDAAEIGRIAGWTDLPASTFVVSGGVRWQGFPIAFDNLNVELGDTTLSLDGVLGAPPRLLGTDLRMRASGPSTAPLASLAGLDLPLGSFRVDGRLVRVDGGVRLDGVAAEIGESALAVDGLVGDPPELAGTDLTITAQCPDLSAFSGLARAELPAGPFEVTGRLAPEGDDVVLHGVRARLGGSSLAVEGRIAAVAGLLGTDLRVRADGPGLAWLEPISGLGGLPDEPYRVEGGVGVVGSGYRLRDVRAELGGTTLEVDGLVGRASGLTGTELAVHAAGPSLSRVAVLAGLEGLPGEPFELRGGLRIADGSYELTGVAAAVGDLALDLDGSVGPPPRLRGTVLRVAARTPHLAILQPFVPQVELPDVPVSAAGRLRADPDGWWLEGLVVDVAGHTVEADGLLSTAAGLVGTGLSLSLVGPDLSDLGRLVTRTGLTDLPELPAEPYAVTGALSVGDAGYGLHGLELTLGRAHARVDGTLGPLPTLVGTDLVLDVDGPDASLFTSVTGVTVPVAPFRVRGRARRLETGFRFDRLRVQLGDSHVMADGVVGEPPALVGTDLAVEARGPSLALVEALGGPGGLPDQPFELTAHLDGDPRRFRSDDLSVRLGASDLRGSFRLDLSTDRPVLHAKLESERIDVTEILADRAVRKRSQAEPDQPDRPSKSGDRVIPDRPLELGVLRGADADVVWSVDELVGPAGRYQDVEIDLELEDGRLRVGPLAVTSSAGGRLGADLVLEPGAGAAYTLRTKLTLANARLDLTREDDEGHALQPSLDADLQLTATGASLHELASTADGSFIVAVGEGQVDSSVLDLITADIVLTLLDTLNPFTSGKKTTTLQCAVVVAAFDGGVVTLEPMAVQTARMTLLGEGRIDLATERLALDWVTKPRKGFGLSASTVTNPYFRLGGSLARPNLEVKPLEAMTATGIAVATGGMSILGKGLLDRITAGRKVCRKAIRKAERRYEERLGSSPMGSRSKTGR